MAESDTNLAAAAYAACQEDGQTLQADYEDSENGQEPWLPHSTQPVALDWIPSCGQEEG